MKVLNKTRMIVAILLLTCVQMAIVMVIPHHHHHDEICLADDFDEDHDHAEPIGHEADCVTHFMAVSQHQVVQHLSDFQWIEVPNLLAFMAFDAELSLLPAQYQQYLQRLLLSDSYIPSPPLIERLAGRAPPVLV